MWANIPVHLLLSSWIFIWEMFYLIALNSGIRKQWRDAFTKYANPLISSIVAFSWQIFAGIHMVWNSASATAMTYFIILSIFAKVIPLWLILKYEPANMNILNSVFAFFAIICIYLFIVKGIFQVNITNLYDELLVSLTTNDGRMVFHRILDKIISIMR